MLIILRNTICAPVYLRAIRSVIKFVKQSGAVQRMVLNSPNVALLVSEYSEEELSITVRDVGLRHHNVLSRRQCEECHHLSGYRVIRHVKRLLEIFDNYCKNISVRIFAGNI